MAETEPQQPSVRPKRGLSPRARIVLGIVALVVVVALAVWFVHYETRGKYLESTDDAYIRADSVTVSPKVTGYVDQVFVADNQDVKAGQPLVRIDARDYKAQTAQYQAQIDVAKANADNVRAGIREQQAAIDQARAQLASSQADARFAAGEVARYAPLAASGAETREKLASLRNQATQAAKTAASNSAALESAERHVASLQAQVRQAEAQGEAAKAQLAAADVDLGSTVVKASVDGRVGDKSVRVGQYVSQGTRMMSVVPLRAIYITANFKETQMGLMRDGQPVHIKVDALPGVELDGHVESVSPGTGAQFSLIPPQNATGNFTKIVQRVPVRVAIDAGPDARRVLVPGLSVEVTVDTIGAKGDVARIKDQEKARKQDGQ
ncbi:HlyD family secretion protein [Sphingomonas sp. CGMCC 1.13654]|uniref:HlyD family secretion protein n=1 Tax=Sphingomonas chungangi TaxID=2683589 RepID=A0A838L317_9SPHN|nr:HlyD family secretion protein [Sphingomonas chungangi]MBA2932616.1 HlyD family secretion protein [Sphingomonas chungangi]MVW56239.1 HlyD family efflux transporter periplasmic adaptor subunit [Sphingomonas chungangi]